MAKKSGGRPSSSGKTRISGSKSGPIGKASKTGAAGTKGSGAGNRPPKKNGN